MNVDQFTLRSDALLLPNIGPRVARAEVAYLQRVVLTVDKALFDDEIYFWKNAMGMRVTREVTGDEGKSVILAFGQETLDADDGWGRGGRLGGTLFVMFE